MRLLPSQIPMALNIITDLALRKELRCLQCGAPLPAWISVYRWDEHYLWAFIVCEECRYQNALWKIFKHAKIPIEVLGC